MEDELAKTVGVKSTEVGYIGGKSSNPTYEQVCSGMTGHTEAVKVTFDQSKSSYKSLIKRFLEIHNPYADISVVHGGQYKSALFYLNSEQHKEAKEALDDFEKTTRRKVATRIEPATTFWRAEEYHQHYYKKHGLGSCRLF